MACSTFCPPKHADPDSGKVGEVGSSDLDWSEVGGVVICGVVELLSVVWKRGSFGSTMKGVKIIGVGNEFRGDDAVGPVAARCLANLGLPGVEVEVASGEGADLMERWKGADTVILIDAVRSGAPPGTVHRIDASRETVPGSFFSYSTHAFSVAEAVELARRLGLLPKGVTLYGIEGLDFSTGQGLTPPVEEALGNVVREIASNVAATPVGRH